MDADGGHFGELEQFIARYYQSCSEVAEGHLLHLSASCDKSRVHSMGVSNCALAMPDNRCWWAPPQEPEGADKGV